MPDLKKEDVAVLTLTQTDEHIEDRRKEVNRILDGHDGPWSELPLDREGRDRLPKMMQELNMLGKHRDTFMDLDSDQAKFLALEKVFDEPEKVLQIPSKKTAPKGDFAKQALEKGGFADRVKEGRRGDELMKYDLTDFGFKATLGEDATAAGVDTDYPVRPDRLPGIVDELFQTPNIADLIPTVATQADTIEYVTENYTDAAVETEEAAAMPEATEDFTLVTENVRKIGVGIKATIEVLGDVGLMRGLLQLRLRQDIARREDLQLLLGDGTGVNLDGIMNRAGIGNANYSIAAGLDDFLEAIFRAAGVVRTNFLAPTVAVMEWGSWEDIRLLRDDSGGAGTGQYLFGPPSIAVEPRVWGMRSVINQNLQDNSTATNVPVLVGDFANSALIARNPNVAVGVTDSDASDFLADVLTFKASIREALIVHRAEGFATVTVVV